MATVMKHEQTWQWTNFEEFEQIYKGRDYQDKSDASIKKVFSGMWPVLGLGPVALGSRPPGLGPWSPPGPGPGRRSPCPADLGPGLGSWARPSAPIFLEVL